MDTLSMTLKDTPILPGDARERSVTKNNGHGASRAWLTHV